MSAAAFCVGVVLAVQAPGVQAVLWFGLGCAAASLAILCKNTPAKVSLLAALVFVGAGMSARSLGPLPAESLGRDLPNAADGRVLVEVEGTALEHPRKHVQPTGTLTPFVPEFMQQGESYRFQLRVRRVKAKEAWRDASGDLSVWVTTDDNASSLAIKGGDTVRITGQAQAVSGPRNPGEFDWTLGNRDRHRVGALWTSPELVTPSEPRSAWERAVGLLVGARSSVQARAAGILEPAVAGNSKASPVVRGLVLGLRDGDTEDVTGAFQRVGLIHLLSVSGFHVAVAAGLALLAIRCTGDRGWLEPAAVCVAMGLYVMIVPMRAPIFRAALLVLAVLASDALGRRHDRISVVSWLAIVWLAIRPSDLFSIGFQLSFGLTMWLMLLAEPTRLSAERIDAPTRAEMVKQFVSRPVHTAAACWSLAIPTVLYHIGVISPLAVVATVVTVPMIVLTMWLGFVVLVLGVLIPPLAPAASALLVLVAGAAAQTALWFDSLSLATVSLYPVTIAWAIAATLSMIWLWRYASLRQPRWIAVAALPIVWLAAEQVVAHRAHSKASEIHMLAVGNASAFVVRSGGDTLLWDCGSWRQDVGAKLLPEACKDLGSMSVDTIVITHANIDHYMGVLDAAKQLCTKRVITGESFLAAASADPDGAPAFVLAELARLGIAHEVVVRGDEISIGKSSLRVIHPPQGFDPRAENDASLAAFFEPADTTTRALLTGDIQQEAMAMLMASGEDLRADVIELPHHGSAHEAAYAFTQIVNPRVVLQSTGTQRLDDPRWDHVREGRAWLTTARSGCASVYISADGEIRVRTYR